MSSTLLDVCHHSVLTVLVVVWRKEIVYSGQDSLHSFDTMLSIRLLLLAVCASYLALTKTTTTSAFLVVPRRAAVHVHYHHHHPSSPQGMAAALSKKKSSPPLRMSTGGDAPDTKQEKGNLPMLLDPGTKGGALFLSLVLFIIPILVYQVVTSGFGVDGIEAGKWIGVGFTAFTTILWVSTYIFRVATKDMTYVCLSCNME